MENLGFLIMAMMYAVLLSLGVVSILTWMTTLIGGGFQGDRLTMAWAVLLLLGHFQLWWTVVSFAEIETWNYFTYLYLLLGPGALFVVTSILLSASSDDPPKPHGFEIVRRKFVITMLVVLVWSLFTGPILEGAAGADTLLNLVFAGVVAGLLFARKRRVQVMLTAASASAAVFLVSVVGYGFRIDP